MTLKRISVAVTLTLGLAAMVSALPAHAQEAAAPAPEGLSMGEPEGGAVGSTYTKANFEQWEQRCVKTESGQDPCQLYQLLKDGEGTAVAEINLFDLPDGGQAAAGSTLIAPLETLLPAGLRIAIDTAEPKVYPFTFCARIGCVARVGFTEAELASFKKGAKASVTIVPAASPDTPVVLEVSLKGFTAGYDAVSAHNAALPQPEAQE